MPDQIFTLTLTIFGILMSTLGFFSAFILTQILKRQTSTEEKLVRVLSRMEAIENQQQSTQGLFNMVFEQLKGKVDTSMCGLRHKDVASR